jgi:hypothetical protein
MNEITVGPVQFERLDDGPDLLQVGPARPASVVLVIKPED